MCEDQELILSFLNSLCRKLQVKIAICKWLFYKLETMRNTIHCAVSKSCPTLCDPMDNSTPLSPGVRSNWCPLSWWCHPIISPSVSSFSSWLQSFPASGSFLQWVISSYQVAQNIGTSPSASVLSINIQGWFLLGFTGLISLLSKGLPSADEWIRKLWYIYTMEHYSAIKKNSFESVLMRCMKLEPIIQSEVSQKDKDHDSILTHIYGI